ncbi:MAG TPA: hypothetical protein VEV17_07125 [Bryobacteraceae bacterium]|nr:hypothetical protein [Bryobacteraceae bacterium]
MSANIQALHLPFGTILDPVYAAPDSDQIVGYTRCGDSAIWTGHYLAAEAFRYKVTQSPDAFSNIQKAIAGIKSLADVTGTNLMARCIVYADSPFAAGIASEEAHNGIHMASPWFWVGNTSRDQYSGVIFGLAVAYDMVDDAATKSSISDLVTRLVRFLTGHNWSVVMPDGNSSTSFLTRPDQILAFVQVGRHVNPHQFNFYYDEQRIFLGDTGIVLIPTGVDVTSNDSYFKFNLDYINFYNLVRLESSSTNAIYEKAYSIVRNHTTGHQNAFFDSIDRALEGPDAARDAEMPALLDQWLQRPSRDPYVDLTNMVPVCGSEACDPIPVPLRIPTDFLWQRDPFQLTGGSQGTIETSGIDYILPYWMGRYYGVIPACTAPLGANPEPEGSASSGAPTLLSADGTGTGAAAAATYSTQANPLWRSTAPSYQCDASGCADTPINLAVATPVYLSLYGTGIRNRSSLSDVVVLINGISAPVVYAGLEAGCGGLDRVDVALTSNLQGSGESSVALTVDGQTANIVTVNIQ